MAIDSFPPWTTRIRKDPLGSAGYNQLTQRFRWVENMFSKEHLLQTGDDVGTAGEHNAIEIPREVGSVYFTAGPTGAVEGFRYATGATRSAAGTIQLALNPDPYPSMDSIALQVTNCSENGASKPAITHATIVSTSRIDFFSQYLTSAIGAGNTWAVDDANLCVAVHGPPLLGGGRSTPGTSKIRGNWLTEDAADINATIEADTLLREKFLDDGIGDSHTTAGAHACREVARTWAEVSFNGAAFVTVDSCADNPVVATTTVSGGVCELEFDNAWTLPAQPFVSTDWRVDSGAGDYEDMFVVCCPRTEITTTKVRVHFYRYLPGSLVWENRDTNFFIVVYAGL